MHGQTFRKLLTDPAGLFVQPVTTVEHRTRLRQILPWAAGVAVLAAIIAGVAIWKFSPPEPKRVMRFDYELPAGQQLTPGSTQSPLAVSADGNQFVYSTTEGLYLRSMNVLDARLIPGTDKDSRQPFFSPDGQWIGYLSQIDQKLKKVAISGGAPVALCDVGVAVIGASWDSDDTIVYSDLASGIMRVSANGGTPESLVKGSIADLTKKGFPINPQMLPDGKTILFTSAVAGDGTKIQIVVQSLQSGERKVLVKGGSSARYLPTGHIVYTLTSNNIRNLFAVPFDLDKLEVTGGSVSVLERVRGPAFSDSGTMVYVPQPAVAAGSTSTTASGRTLVWVDRQGKEEALGAEPDAYDGLKISPDGARVALSIRTTGNQDIWTWDIPHKTPTKLTFDKASDSNPIWTPDGKRIVFNSLQGGGLGGVYWKSADGIGEAELLASKPDRGILPWSLSPDGKILAATGILHCPSGA